jgi:copper transport protein
MKSTGWINLAAKFFLLCLICLGLVVCCINGVQAHAFLIRSDPADNSVLEEAPQAARLWFSEALIPGLSSAHILDLDGNQIEIDSIQVDPSDPKLMTLGLPQLEQGVYTVSWEVSSAFDGHASRGYFVFRIGETTASANTTGAGTSSGLGQAPLPGIILRWLNYLGLIVSTGCIAILLFVLKPEVAAPNPQIDQQISDNPPRKRILKFGMIATGFAFLIGLALLVWEVINLGKISSGFNSPFQVLGEILTKTPWGHAWLGREIILLILLWVLFWIYRSVLPLRRQYLLALALVLGAMVAQSLVSHAAAEPKPALAVMVNTLHLAFAGFWIGGLMALLVGYQPLLRRQNLPLIKEELRQAWMPFSRLAAISVGIVIASGIYSTGQLVISPDAVLLSSYGRVLATKVGVVLVVGLVGLSNSILLHPKLVAPVARLLKKPEGWMPFKISQFPGLLMAEAGLGLLVVLLAGLLTSLPPARDLIYTISVDEQVDQANATINDIYVKFAIKPNRPGTNLVNVVVLSSRRPPPADILRVIVKMTYLDQDIGTTIQDAEFIERDDWEDTYRFPTTDIAQPGHWKIEVVVRRKGLTDSTAVFNWTVLPLGDIRPPLVSRLPWQKYLVVLAGILGALVLFLAGIGMIDQDKLRMRRKPSNQETSV